MIIWLVSLVWASLMFGGRVDGSPSLMQVRASQDLTSQIRFNVTFDEGGSPVVVYLNHSSTIHYSMSSAANVSIPAVSIILCQTSSSDPSATINSSNTWQVAQLFSTVCVNGDDLKCPAQGSDTPLVLGSIASTFDLSPLPSFNADHDPDNLLNFFLCFAQTKTPPVCNAYSPVFDLIDSGQNPSLNTPRVIDSSMSVMSTNSVLSVLSTTLSNDAGSITASPTASSSIRYVYGSPTGTTYVATTTIPPTSTAAADGVFASHSKSGLSTGALVGIIVGAVGGALILAVLGLLCTRHRKHTRSNRSNIMDSNQTEHVLLTQPYSAVGSRDQIGEKGSPTTLASMLETPLSRPTLLPENPRHSYDSLNASAPYSGLAAAAPRPRSHSPQDSQSLSQTQPQQQSLLAHSIPSSNLSRGISDASGTLSRGISDASGPISARSTVRGEGDEFEEYHDVPIYGDARHTPTVYESHPSLQAPFLSEEGMSAEEIARLEEEERRIDAAIAAAEDNKRR